MIDIDDMLSTEDDVVNVNDDAVCCSDRETIGVKFNRLSKNTKCAVSGIRSKVDPIIGSIKERRENKIKLESDSIVYDSQIRRVNKLAMRLSFAIVLFDTVLCLYNSFGSNFTASDIIRSLMNGTVMPLAMMCCLFIGVQMLLRHVLCIRFSKVAYSVLFIGLLIFSIYNRISIFL